MATSTTPSRTTARRYAPLVAVALVVLVAVVVLVPRLVDGSATPGADGRLEIVMEDYRFEPSDLELPTGTPLELVFVNRDDTVHHVSFGRDVIVDAGDEVGFAEDLLAGTDARIDPSRARVGPSDQFPTLSVQVEPGTTATLYVTLPEDRAGEWQMGCFTARGCQFRTGLAGTIEVG
jgi:plastocyanin